MSYDDPDPLCCCEYFDRNNERNHILACFCNCVDFDSFFDRVICCRSVSSSIKSGMLLTFQDRIRLPWKGGAKKLSVDTILPIFMIPALLAIAAINSYCSAIVFIAIPVFLGYSYFYIRRNFPKSKFFYIWGFWSVIYNLFLFQTTIPIYEILPEENYAYILLIALSLFCFYKVKQRASLNHFVGFQSSNPISDDENLPAIEEEQTTLLINDDVDNNVNSNICEYCRKCVPPKTYHCHSCQACILEINHHNSFLNCCIGDSNRKLFILGVIFALLALLLGNNLAMTSICHPVLVTNIFGIVILLPDDCSDVYGQYDVAVGFVSSIYNLLMAFWAIIVLLHQCTRPRGPKSDSWEEMLKKEGTKIV